MTSRGTQDSRMKDRYSMSSANPIRRIILPLEMPRSSFVSFCGIIVSGGAETASGSGARVGGRGLRKEFSPP